jgi:hypothetical protein
MGIEASDLILSANRALWGIVTPNLRKASIRCEEKTIIVSFFYDKKITEDEKELASCAGAEVIADYPAEFFIEEELFQIASPNPLPQKGYTVYHRYEQLD